MSKKILSVILVLTTTTLFATAGGGKIQMPNSSSNDGMHFGVTAGLNLANLSGADPAPAMLIGFNVGGVLNLGLTDNLSLAPELLFSMKGAHDNTSSTETQGGLEIKTENDLNSTLTYIEIPILVKFSMESGFNISAGPYIGLLMGSKFKGTVKTTATIAGTPVTTTSDIDLDTKDSTEGMDFGFDVGVGFDMESGLGFGARFSKGLADIAKDNPGDAITNTVISINVHYMLGMN